MKQFVTKYIHTYLFQNYLRCFQVHVSFSLTSSDSGRVKVNANRRSNFLLQSLGILTDINDNLFRLGYFERKHNFYSAEDLQNEIMMHYTSQFAKQFYVTVFGLEILGNPFGLVTGATRGVEDLFYEPFVGAVEGMRLS